MTTAKQIQNAEQKIVRNLVSRIVENKMMISVFDGEEFCLKRSTNIERIIEALGSTECDELHIRDADGIKVGVILLIWGNGFDVISDHSDNVIINGLVN